MNISHPGYVKVFSTFSSVLYRVRESFNKRPVQKNCTHIDERNVQVSSGTWPSGENVDAEIFQRPHDTLAPVI